MALGWLIVLIILSAFFSGVETAFTHLSSLKLAHMVDNKLRNAQLIKQLKADEHRLLITILIGNNIVNIAAASIAAVLATEYFGNAGIGIATAVMTLVVLIFGEITPKSIAIKNAQFISQFAAWPIYVLYIILRPLVISFDFISRGISRMFGIKESQKRKFTEPLLVTAVKESAKEGSIKKIEKEIITNVFKFDAVPVKEIMTPRTDMVTISAKESLSSVLEIMMNKGHSRVPVYDKEHDNIVGIAYVKDLINAVKENKLNAKVKTVMRKADFVPESKKVDTLLTQFQKKKSQIAVVVDEHGGIAGLVTFEDVLEEIVGEIYDESDKDHSMIKKKGKKTFLVKAKVPIDDLNRELNLKIDEADHYDTFGGYILHKLGRIPKVDEEIDFKKFKAVIDNVIKQRIISVKIVKK